jgi:hypothetical protein
VKACCDLALVLSTNLWIPKNRFCSVLGSAKVSGFGGVVWGKTREGPEVWQDEDGIELQAKYGATVK